MELKRTAAILILIFIFAICASCTSKNGDPVSDEPSLSETESFSVDISGEEQTWSEPSSSAEPSEEATVADDRISAPVMADNSSGCYYGDATGTDKTYTGLEPLPLTDFPGAVFDNTKGLPDKMIEHSFGVAKNEEPHDISKNNQAFFDDGDYRALALDNRAEGKVLYLTFDCGYENGYTAKILDVLKEKNVKAAFFCTLPEMKENPEIIARMINEGHIVGNHSVNHPNFANLSRREMYEEVKGFDDYIREHFGYSSFYFRYPQGKYSEDSLDFLNSMGFRCIFWSLAYEDWDLNSQKGTEYAVDTVVSRLHPGAVILLHAVSPDNAGGLGEIIDRARGMGYGFKLLSEADI